MQQFLEFALLSQFCLENSKYERVNSSKNFFCLISHCLHQMYLYLDKVELSISRLDYSQTLPQGSTGSNLGQFGSKLWSRRVAQFYLVIYSSKMKILHIFAILGTLQIGLRSKTLKVNRMESCEKNKPLFERIAGCIWSLE